MRNLQVAGRLSGPAFAFLLCLLLGACRGGTDLESPRLYDGFSGYDRPVTAASPEAPRWFDQGLQLVYGFNHDEAIRSFGRAAELDPDCARWLAEGHGARVPA